jgi:lysine 2,3-aminomutase
MFKDVCLHTHFNHPHEITPLVERAMRRLHEEGVFVRNQSVLLRGVNDDTATLTALIKGLSRINVHPYYVYLCDMVKGTEHFRVSIRAAQQFEKQVRGTTAGFNTPLFIADTPGGKRDIHSVEFHDHRLGISAFRSPAVASDRLFYYFDPIRSLDRWGREAWNVPGIKDEIVVQLNRSARALAEERRTLSQSFVTRAAANGLRMKFRALSPSRPT